MELHLNNWWDYTLFIIVFIPLTLVSILVLIGLIIVSFEESFNKGKHIKLITIILFVLILMYRISN